MLLHIRKDAFTGKQYLQEGISMEQASVLFNLGEYSNIFTMVTGTLVQLLCTLNLEQRLREIVNKKLKRLARTFSVRLEY